MIEFILGVAVTLFILLIIGMYQDLKKEITRLQTGVVYLVKREYEFEQSEIELQKEMDRNKEALNRVGVN
ncbi:MAG: hypothetical protein LC124_05085 [Ignavibacteriales bacterium]|jgi:septation ring formation regulator EzrA|nr:hypothetical protein [Ignavibacteriales bacterium]